jgi:hypothetical protein
VSFNFLFSPHFFKTVSNFSLLYILKIGDVSLHANSSGSMLADLKMMMMMMMWLMCFDLLLQIKFSVNIGWKFQSIIKLQF